MLTFTFRPTKHVNIHPFPWLMFPEVNLTVNWIQFILSSFDQNEIQTHREKRFCRESTSLRGVKHGTENQYNPPNSPATMSLVKSVSQPTRIPRATLTIPIETWERDHQIYQEAVAEEMARVNVKGQQVRCSRWRHQQLAAELSFRVVMEFCRVASLWRARVRSWDGKNFVLFVGCV